MKKLIAILLLGALLLLSVVGCNVPDENVGTTPDATIESTTPVPLPDLTTPDIPNSATPTEQDPPSFIDPPIIIVPPYDNLFDGTEKEFVADIFDEMISSSWPIKLKVTIKDTQIFVNDILYESVTVVENPQITYEESYLRAFEVGQEVQKLKILAQIKNSNSCYILETANNSWLGKKIAIFYIDGAYYFVFFIGENVLRIFQTAYNPALSAEDCSLALVEQNDRKALYGSSKTQQLSLAENSVSYLLQDSEVMDANGNWSASNGAYDLKWREYNCYAYAINRAEQPAFYDSGMYLQYQPGNMSRYASWDEREDVEELAELVVQDLRAMGYTNITFSNTIPTINSTQELICVRLGPFDYHFMRYDLETNA